MPIDEIDFAEGYAVLVDEAERIRPDARDQPWRLR
jgi:hypothetical protein